MGRTVEPKEGESKYVFPKAFTSGWKCLALGRSKRRLEALD
jgi:hypothetical protein